MATLAELRAKLQAQEQRQQGARETDNAIYAFWNIPNDSTATLRFLPDGDEDNTFFWMGRQMIRMQFPGVKGQDEARSINVNVPCIEMWGDPCPVHAKIRPWFKDPTLEDIARKYWKKRSYIFQGFVVNSTLIEDSVPENPIRRFVINPSIFKIIKAALMDPEMEHLPTDYVNGTDFRLTKTQKGQYADYSTSNWARKERALTADEASAVQDHNLFTLNDYLPKRPTEEGVRAIDEMFEASVEGELYDPDRWAQFYKPFGIDVKNVSTQTTQTTTSTTLNNTVSESSVVNKVPVSIEPKETEKELVAMATASDSTAKASAEDILAMLRDRKKS